MGVNHSAIIYRPDTYLTTTLETNWSTLVRGNQTETSELKQFIWKTGDDHERTFILCISKLSVTLYHTSLWDFALDMTVIHNNTLWRNIFLIIQRNPLISKSSITVQRLESKFAT